MGLVLSVICVLVYCVERSLTWLLAGVFVLIIMFVAFITAMYGITVGYHMAQKRMLAKLEHNIAKNELAKPYRGMKLHDFRRSAQRAVDILRNGSIPESVPLPTESSPGRNEATEILSTTVKSKEDWTSTTEGDFESTDSG